MAKLRSITLLVALGLAGAAYAAQNPQSPGPADAQAVTDPHAVAWPFNIRGADVAHTPLPLAYAVIPHEGRPATASAVLTRKQEEHAA